MKTKTATVPAFRQQPLYTFRCEAAGYDIALIPHSAKDCANLKAQARTKHMNLRDFCQDEILAALSFANFEVTSASLFTRSLRHR